VFGSSSGASPSGEPRLRRASRLRREPYGFAGCLECRHQVEPATASLRADEGGTGADPAAKLLTEPSHMASPAEMARRYGPETRAMIGNIVGSSSNVADFDAPARAAHI